MIATRSQIHKTLESLGSHEVLRDASRDNCRRLSGVFGRSWWRRPRPRPSEWAERCVRLSGDVEAQGGPYECRRNRPWWAEVLDATYGEDCPRTASIRASTQVGKTLQDIVGILYCAEWAPAPGMAVLPDQDSAVEFRDRVYANARASILHHVTVPPPHKWNVRWIDLGSMRVYLAWSGSRQRLRGRPCKYVWLIEVDVYRRGDAKAGNPIAAAQQRTKAHHRFLHLHESSPSESPSAITSLELASDRRRWHCRCPHCGREQLLRFFPQPDGRGGVVGLRDAHGQWLDPEQARDAAWYCCEAGCRIGNADKSVFVVAGRWIAERPGNGRKIGFHLWSALSHTASWGDIGAAFVEARTAGTLAEYHGNWLGHSFERPSKVPSWRQLGTRLAGTHNRQEVPAEAWFLTSGADVQGDKVVYSVRGWAPTKTSWLVDWGELDRQADDEAELVKSDLDQLRWILDRTYPVVGCPANPLGRSEVRIRLLCVDSNHRIMDVHQWLQSLPASWIRGDTARVRAVRGDHHVNPSKRYRISVLEQNTRTGEVYDGGLEQWGIYVYLYYQNLTERLSGRAGVPGAWHVTADALHMGRDYLQQVTNFHRVVARHPKTGKKRAIWRPRSDAIDIDYWDTEVYAEVAADMVVGDLGWAADAWESWRTQRPAQSKPAPDDFAAR